MIAALLPIIGSVIDKVIPDVAGREKAKTDMEAALVANANAINLAIQDVNKAEAQHRSLFVAGWRPFCGWIAASGFGWVYVVNPILAWVLALMGSDVVLPQIDTAPLMELLVAMLGLGGLRTFEKLKGLTK